MEPKAAVESGPSTTAQPAEPVKSVARKKLLSEAIRAWDARLLARLREELADGRRPKFLLSSMRLEVAVSAADEDGTLSMKSRGVILRMSLSRMKMADRRNLALVLLRRGKPDDHCLAAFYLLATGAAREAEAHLQRGGDGAAAVRTVFK